MGKNKKNPTKGTEQHYVKSGLDKTGSHNGYVAKKNFPKSKSIDRTFYIKDGNPVPSLNVSDSNHEILKEALAAPFYRIALDEDLAPKIRLITSKDNPTHPKIASRIINSVGSLFEKADIRYSSVKKIGGEVNSKKIRALINKGEIKGFEDALAASIVLGETDAHTRNLIVKEDGRIAKIDHGRSFSFYNEEDQQYISVTDLFNEYVTNKNFNTGQYDENLFKTEAFADSLIKQSQIDYKKYDQVIDKVIDDIKKKFGNNLDVFKMVYTSITGEKLSDKSKIDKAASLIKDKLYKKLEERQKEAKQLGNAIKLQLNEERQKEAKQSKGAIKLQKNIENGKYKRAAEILHQLEMDDPELLDKKLILIKNSANKFEKISVGDYLDEHLKADIKQMLNRAIEDEEENRQVNYSLGEVKENANAEQINALVAMNNIIEGWMIAEGDVATIHSKTLTSEKADKLISKLKSKNPPIKAEKYNSAEGKNEYRVAVKVDDVLAEEKKPSISKNKEIIENLINTNPKAINIKKLEKLLGSEDKPKKSHKEAEPIVYKKKGVEKFAPKNIINTIKEKITGVKHISINSEAVKDLSKEDKESLRDSIKKIKENRKSKTSENSKRTDQEKGKNPKRSL
jgi:hypothetical protein